MGDAAYERAATADEIARMCALVREAHRRGRGGILDELLVRAPRRRRQAGAEPLRRRRRGRRAVPRRGRGGQGRRAHHARASSARYADVYEWQPRIGRPFTYPLFARPGGKHLEPVGAARAGPRSTARNVWPQVTPRPLTMQFTMADAVQPQHRHGVRRADARSTAPCAHRRLPRSGVAGAGGGGPRAVADEAALGDLRGLRVGTVPRARRAGG